LQDREHRGEVRAGRGPCHPRIAPADAVCWASAPRALRLKESCENAFLVTTGPSALFSADVRRAWLSDAGWAMCRGLVGPGQPSLADKEHAARRFLGCAGDAAGPLPRIQADACSVRGSPLALGASQPAAQTSERGAVSDRCPRRWPAAGASRRLNRPPVRAGPVQGEGTPPPVFGAALIGRSGQNFPEIVCRLAIFFGQGARVGHMPSGAPPRSVDTGECAAVEYRLIPPSSLRLYLS
jgi:hypothetical protein